MLSNKSIYILILLISSVLYWSCQPGGSQSASQESSVKALDIALDNDAFPYNLSVLDGKFELPSELVEVSGLSFSSSERIAMVQDELGTIFFLDIETENVLEEKKEFAKAGDFEGIEIVEDTAYVLRSDGVIFSIYPYGSDTPTIQQYKTDLSIRNDTEGLGYLPNSHELIIACKATPNFTGKKQKDHRAIYLFDLKSKVFRKSPYLQIPIKDLRTLIDDDTFNRLSKDIAKIFSHGGDLNFQPSAVAVHPITSDVYILASVGKLLLVFNPAGTMINMIKLDKKVFEQPEGICFQTNGDMFISNEGGEGQGNVLRFNYQSTPTTE